VLIYKWCGWGWVPKGVPYPQQWLRVALPAAASVLALAFSTDLCEPENIIIKFWVYFKNK